MEQRLTGNQSAAGKPEDMSGVWMNLHLVMMLSTVFVAVAIECLIFFASDFFHLPIHDPQKYMFRFMLAPLCLNLFLLLAAFWARHSKRLKESVRVGMISFCMAGIALTLYTMHRFFPAMNMLLMTPVVLTILYGRMHLTLLVGAVSVVGKLIADFFLGWMADLPPFRPVGPETLNWLISLVVLISCCAVSGCLVCLFRRQIDFSVGAMLEQQRLREKTMTDSLTGVGNRRALQIALTDIDHQDNSLWFFAMMDIDHFKLINDQLGHIRGDFYLQSLGRILRFYEDDASRFFRYGGDEFCAILHAGNAEEAAALCRQIQSEFARIVGEDAGPISSGISIGLTACASGEDAQAVMKRADTALYRVKKYRRGTVSIWESALERVE